MRHCFSSLILIGSLLFGWPVTMVRAAGGPETPESTLSGMAGRTNDLLVQVSEAAGNAGFELETCTLKSSGGQEGSTVEIAARIDGFDALRGFLAELGKERSVGLRRLVARPQAESEGKMRVNVEGELAIASKGSGNVGAGLDEILKPMDDLPFFLPGSGRPDQPKLVGLAFETGRGTVFQLVAARLEDFAALRSRPGMPARSQTISRSSFTDGELYNLDFSGDPESPATDELLGIFNLLTTRVGTREVSMRKGPDGQRIRLRLDLFPERFGEILVLFTEKKWSIVECDATPQTPVEPASGPSRWSGLVTLQVGGNPENTVVALQDWRQVLGLAWPGESLGTLRYAWKPERSTLAVQVDSALVKRGPNGVEFDPSSVPPSPTAERPAGKPFTLREAFDELGMKFLESRPLAREEAADLSDGETPRLLVTFFRQGAGKAGEIYAKPLSTNQEKTLFPVGTVLERKQRTDGNWYRLQVSRDQLPQLVGALAPRENQSLTQFALTCNPPADPEVTLTLANSVDPQAAGRTEAIRQMVAAAFPWNQPMESLPKQIVLSQFDLLTDGTMVIIGWTAKSSRIFSELFPVLKRIPGLEEPFFREGNYRDSPQGRIMRFKATTRFVPLESGR